MPVRILALVMWLACCCNIGLWPADAVAASPSKRKVLIIYSWHDQMPWQSGTRAGLTEHLQQVPAAERPEIYEHRLDAGRIKDVTSAPLLHDYLRDMYAHIPLDAVIADSQSATNFLLRHPDLFPQVKRYAVNAVEPGSIPPQQSFVMQENPTRALLASLQVMPDRERVFAVVDVSANGRRIKEELTAAVTSLPKDVRLEVLDNYSFDELYAQVQHLPPRSLILYFPTLHDRLGVSQIPRDVVKRIAEIANTPVFAHHDTFLGTGIVGGYLLSARGTGDLLARIAMGSVLPDTPEGIDAIVKGYHFDTRQLERWGIPKERLPTPHRLIGDSPSTWSIYRWQIGGIVLVLILESLLIALLLRNRRDRIKAIDALTDERRHLEQRVAERTTELTASMSQLRLAASVFANSQEGIIITDAGGFIIDVNPAFMRITGYARDEVLGRTPKMLSSGHQDAAFYARMWQSLRETGAWRGEIWNRNKAGEVYPELLSIAAVSDDAGEIANYISSFSDITNLKDREAQLDRIAHFDPLTELPNRRLLSDRLRQAVANTRRTGKIMAVCVLDLDNFKPINDSLGHAAGDQVLIEVAQRLSSCVREGDTVARLGGDEFVLLLVNLAWVEECDAILTRMLETVTAPVSCSDQLVSVSASIGITLFPQDPVDADLLLRHADHAMYLAKQAGRNQYRLFDAEHDRLVREHRRLIEDLAEALAQEQFILYYQPKVDMTAERVVGAEALIRWRHPERGLLAPAEFLYAVAGSELEIPLGEWVIRNAIKQVAAWKTQGLTLPISVNLVARHLQHPAFTERLAAALASCPTVSGTDLEIEILESSALADIEHASSLIKACQALGVRVALDDFGTGYSSLSYFKHLPVDILKIDQTFIRDMQDDPEDMAIVEGVIRLAEAFGREVIAEGVENIEQGSVLIHLGCRLAQGYAIARPMPADSVLNWIAHWLCDPSWKMMAGLPLAREDLALVIAESSHQQWVNQLIAYLEADAVDALPPPNGKTCRFGRWLAGQGRTQYQHLPDFGEIEALHKSTHTLADEIVKQHAVDAAGARDRIGDIKLLRDRVVEKIGGLIATVLTSTIK